MSRVSVTHCNFPPSSQEDSLINLVSSKRAALESCYCRSLTAKESRGQERASPEQRVHFSQRLQLAEGQWGLCVSFKRDERWRSTSVTRSEGKRKEGVPQLTRQSRRAVYQLSVLTGRASPVLEISINHSVLHSSAANQHIYNKPIWFYGDPI